MSCSLPPACSFSFFCVLRRLRAPRSATGSRRRVSRTVAARKRQRTEHKQALKRKHAPDRIENPRQRVHSPSFSYRTNCTVTAPPLSTYATRSYATRSVATRGGGGGGKLLLQGSLFGEKERRKALPGHEPFGEPLSMRFCPPPSPQSPLLLTPFSFMSPLQQSRPPARVCRPLPLIKLSLRVAGPFSLSYHPITLCRRPHHPSPFPSSRTAEPRPPSRPRSILPLSVLLPTAPPLNITGARNIAYYGIGSRSPKTKFS